MPILTPAFVNWFMHMPVYEYIADHCLTTISQVAYQSKLATSRLTSLDLEDNLFVRPIPSSLGKLSKLSILYVFSILIPVLHKYLII
jgi:hypothetical protein